MKCLSGTVKETRFAWPEKKKTKMTETGYTVGTEGDVIHINGKNDSGLNWSFVAQGIICQCIGHMIGKVNIFHNAEGGAPAAPTSSAIMHIFMIR